MADLTPEAQAVLDAFDSKWAVTRHQALCAALHAACDGMSMDWTPIHCITYLRAIAVELEMR